ncbi:MAG: cytochrome P450 [Acidimicrobiales bacterium]
MTERVVLTGYHDVIAAYRNRDLRQALFDEGVVMQDVLINLHGDEHRARRRLENRLFRRETFAYYERELFPQIVADTLAPHVAAGQAELVSLGHQMMMNLGALSAGIDRPAGTAEESFRLYEFMMVFIEGATIANYLGDKVALEAKVRAALAEFDREFVVPSAERRRALLTRVDRGEDDDGTVPRDVLTVLLRNVDELELADDVILREIAFYLLSGAHTTATSFTRTVHRLLDNCDDHPEERQRVIDDRGFVQRAVHEVLRLEPPSPVRRRRAMRDLVLADGTKVVAGQIVDLDLVAANRDPAVFGDNADDFAPERHLPNDVPPWGTSFGTGMHACIGQDLAAGCLDDDGTDTGELLGLVPLAVQSVFRAGVSRLPDDPPVVDELTSRGYFKRYPVKLEARST